MTRSQPGEQVFIIDAGDRTIDISTYTVLNNRPLQVEELYEPMCEPDQPWWWILPFDGFYLRPGSGWRDCYNEGNRDGPRHVLTFRLQTDYLIRNQGY